MKKLIAAIFILAAGSFQVAAVMHDEKLPPYGGAQVLCLYTAIAALVFPFGGKK